MARLPVIALTSLLVLASASSAHADELGSEWKLGAPHELDLRVNLGSVVRLDEPPAFELLEPATFAFGASLDVLLAKRVSLGLAYEHMDLGREKVAITETGSGTISRDVNAGWLNLRILPVLGRHGAMVLRLGVAAAWQSGALAASVWPESDPGRAVPFRCEGAGSVGFGVGGELGGEVRVGSGRVGLGLAVENMSLGDEPLDGCLPGAGTVQMLGLRLRIGGGIDVGGGA